MLEPHQVVTLLLYHRGRILLLLRSRGVRTQAGRWAGISGSVEAGETPVLAAGREMEEEVGLPRSSLAVRVGGVPLEIPDPSRGLLWRIHPMIGTAEIAGPLRLNWEHTAYRWIFPEEVSQVRAVPHLASTLAALLGGLELSTLRPWRGRLQRILDAPAGTSSGSVHEALSLLHAMERDRRGARPLDAVVQLLVWGLWEAPDLAIELEEGWRSARLRRRPGVKGARGDE